MWVTTLSLFSSVSCCCLPNLRNSTKIRTYSSSRSSKVTDHSVSGKRICNFLLVNNINYRWLDVSLTVFEILTHLAAFSPHPCLAPTSGGTPCNISVIYTPLRSTFNGLQFSRWHYGSIFIRLAAVGSQNSRNHTKFRQNLTFKVFQGHRSWCQSKAHMWLPISD